MRIKAFFVKWYAKLTGGHAVWIKDTCTGRIWLLVARAQFDPFNMNNDKLIAHIKDSSSKTLVILDVKSATVVNFSSLKWRFVDDAAHVEQQLSIR
jgi:hypothetical protein